MREIRFRAWDKKLKKMFDDFFIYSDGHWQVFSNNDWGKNGLWEHSIGEEGEEYDLELMEFTGLLDRQGKEIWEGDILEYYSSLIPKGSNPIVRQVVTWNECHWEGIRNWKTSEVIGNLYENPDLLVGEK
jgi:uncharacterized phage protein (TIGR01671 family)